MNQELLQFLNKTKFSKEFLLFLEQYQNLEPDKFAIIKVSGSTLENHIDSISEDIAFLNKFKLYPILVHGAGSSLDKVVSNKKINGIRFTSDEDILKVRKITDELTDELVKSVEEHGGKALNMTSALECDYLDKDLYGNVGKIINIDSEKISEAIKNGFTPVFSNIAFNHEGKPFNINADSVAESLFDSFTTKRLFFITETGGVLDSSDRIIRNINLSDTTAATGGMRFKLDTVKSIIEAHPNSAIVITSAQNLIKEIFTIKGSGTFISNFKINRYDSLDEIDIPKLRALLNSAFKKILNPDYFDNGIKSVYLHNDYKAAAIFKEVDGVDYMCKFAVVPTHQGTGLAKYLWDTLTKDYTDIIWRSKSTNPANNFYNTRCRGLIKSDDWHIYWYGRKFMPNELINKVAEIKESFKIWNVNYEIMG